MSTVSCGSLAVNELKSPATRCDCADYLWRETICKHILAALIREGNEQVLGEVGRLVARLRAA